MRKRQATIGCGGETQTFTRQGRVFEVSVGYRSLEDYAAVMRSNRKILDTWPYSEGLAEQMALYDREIALLEEVGL